MVEPILVAVAWPYANAEIHVGNLTGAYLPADIFARFQRLKGRQVLMVSGSDAHGTPITIQADAEKVQPQDIYNRYHATFLELFQKVGLTYDLFTSTHTTNHFNVSQKIFLSLKLNGFMYTDRQKQWFSPGQNRFLPDRYVEGTCYICGFTNARSDQCDKCGNLLDPTLLIEPRSRIDGSTPELRETEHYYLDLGRLQDKVVEFLRLRETYWRPNVLRQSLGQIQADGLHGRPITRDLDWGIPVPIKGWNGKCLYVWFEAVIGYLSASIEWADVIGEPDAWRAWWHDVSARSYYFIGKDNIVFHAIIWPLILMGHGDFVLPDNIPANEYLTLEGGKISTSRNYAVWLDEYLEKFPPDPLRYCIAANAPETKDADFSWREFQQRNNSELADILGNYINRSLTFLNKNFNNTVPAPGKFDKLDDEMLSRLQHAPAEIGSLFERFEVRKAVSAFMDLARFANKYFNDQQPWVTIKQDTAKCATTFYVCVQVLKGLAILMEPVLPFSARKLWRMLNLAAPFEKQIWDDAGTTNVPAGHHLGTAEILFEKIDDSVIEPEIEKLKSMTAKPTEPKEEPTVTEKITYEQFQKIELRIARVVAAEKVAKADKLLKMQIDLGDEKRQIVAGIAQHYQPEEMIGKQIVVVSNLEPAKIRGIDSDGMLLAAVEEGGKLSIIIPEKEMANGTRIR